MGTVSRDSYSSGKVMALNTELISSHPFCTLSLAIEIKISLTGLSLSTYKYNYVVTFFITTYMHANKEEKRAQEICEFGFSKFV